MVEATINTWVLVWLGVAALVLIRHWRTGVGAGLVFTFVLSFGAMHVLVPLLYLIPWFDSDRLELTALGLRQAALAIVAFAVGSEIALAVIRRRLQIVPDDEAAAPVVDNRIVNLYFIAGAVLYGVIFPIAGRLPSVTALVSTGSTLGVVAVGLKCWNAWSEKRWSRLWLWLAATTLLPLVTVLGQGFLGYGFAAMLTVFAFVASFYRPRWHVVAAGLVLAYLGLSVYVTYMRDRGDIRAVVWTGAGVGERVEQLTDTFRNTEWFDFNNLSHLRRVDERLNQDFLLGAAIVYLESGTVPFAHGGTFRDAAFAVIPRALWPNKPATGGSGDLVADYTGFRFADGTSVGIGQVMEAYVNFGTEGILVTFVIIGIVLSLVDRYAFVRLRAGEAGRFLLWYLPGLSLLQVGGSFMEITSTGAAGLLMAILLNKIATTLYPDRRQLARRADGTVASQPEVTS
jgi:hypothetical protein